MKHPKSIQISIPQPCSEDWNKMTPQQQGRFCDSCQKCVVDFTGFTDAQLYQFITEYHGQKVCGRFSSVQLNRQINTPPQPHSQLYKWIMAAGLALVFVAAPEGKVFAQAPLVERRDNVNTMPREKTALISGFVSDYDDNPIKHAIVQVLIDDSVIETTVTDLNGKFVFRSITGEFFKLKIDALGYKQFVSELSVTEIPYKIKLSNESYQILMDDFITGMMIRTVDATLYSELAHPTLRVINAEEIER